MKTLQKTQIQKQSNILQTNQKHHHSLTYTYTHTQTPPQQAKKDHAYSPHADAAQTCDHKQINKSICTWGRLFKECRCETQADMFQRCKVTETGLVTCSKAPFIHVRPKDTSIRKT